MPTAPSLNEQELAPVVAADRPRSVNVAFIMWLVVGVILLVSVALVLAVSDESLKDAARTTLDRQGKKNPTPQELDDAVSLIRTFGVVFNLVFAALVLGFAFFMRAGRNWARISVTVVGGILIVLSLFGGGVNVAFVVLELLIILGAVAFMYRADAKAFFAAGKARR
jgi:hypothetical protein